MIEPEAVSNWSQTATTAITVIGGIITAIVTHYFTKRKTQAADKDKTVDAARHIDNITDSPTREALLALEDEIHVRRQVVHAYLNAQGIACWESDKHGSCIFASERLAEIVGLDRADILGDGWVTNLAEADRDRVYKAWQNAVSQKRGFTMTYMFIHADGAQVRVSANAHPILRDTMNHDGTLSRELRGMIGVLTVTEGL
ncbi:MAG: PAS domain S-box protein [Desulfurellales bacterium]|nr:MAG: PAS domain S-box protein [Desulfurellales bacterium]